MKDILTKKVLFILCILVMPSLSHSQIPHPAGYDELILPALRFNGKIKKVITKTYSQRIRDTDTISSKHQFDEIQILLYDTLGHLLQSTDSSTLEEPRYKSFKGCIEKCNYTYYGKDSVMEYMYFGKAPSKPKTNMLASQWLKTIYKYNTAGKISEQDFYIHNRKFLSKVINTYDSHGFLIRQDFYGDDDTANDSIEFENDKYGNHLKIKKLKSREPLDSAKVYTYDNHKNPLSEYEYIDCPTLFKYVYDANGNWIRLTKLQGGTCDNIIENYITREIEYYTKTK